MTRNFSNASGSVGLIYNPSPGWAVKANVGTGYRMPNLEELTADGLLREVHEYRVGDSDLSAERNVESDLGFTFNSLNFSFDANGFYNYFDNFIYRERSGKEVAIDPDDAEMYDVYYFRQAPAALYGGETGFAIRPQSINWLKLSSRFEVVIGEFTDRNDNLPLMPAPNWTNAITLSQPKIGPFNNIAFELSLQQYFRQNRNASFEEETPGYMLTDVSLNGSLPLQSNHIQISLAVHNLFDVKYISHLSLLKNDDIPNMGRSVNHTARIPFEL